MNNHYDIFQRTKHFGSLDGLRCLSILGVIWSHTGALAFEGITLSSRGWLGVQLFFAISGFLITTLLLRERRRRGDISLGNFYVRRTLRIFPLYYTVLLIYMVLVWHVEANTQRGHLFWHNLPYFLSYTSNWFVGTGSLVIFSFAWSLATEEQFYLVWPSIEKRGGRWFPVALAAAVVVVVQAVKHGLAGDLLPDGSLCYRILTGIPEPICLGVLVAHLLDSPRGYALARRLFGFRWSSAAAMTAFLLAASWLHMPHLLISLLLAWLVGACVIREDHVLAPLLAWRPIVYLGAISYGMYLMHPLVVALLRKISSTLLGGHPLAAFVAVTLLTTIVAGLSFRYYEQFFLRFKSRFASDGEPSPLPVPSPSVEPADTLEPASPSLEPQLVDCGTRS